MANCTRNVFYTDDDPDDRENFIEALEEVTNEVCLFIQKNGMELIKTLNNPPPAPSLLFLDLNMPVKSGFEVLGEIRASPEWSKLPIIVFSTSDDANNINSTKELGADLYIPKPNSYSGLKKAIAFGLSIDWKSYHRDADNFVYRAEKKN